MFESTEKPRNVSNYNYMRFIIRQIALRSMRTLNLRNFRA